MGLILPKKKKNDQTQGRVWLLLPRVSVTLVLKIVDFGNPGKDFCVRESHGLSFQQTDGNSVYPEFLGILNVLLLHGRG